ncbi:TnsD family Tn7-like transposition protein [Brevibacillus centrosporus]|uniref:TnsD family Tn7-like transposition protein n=1 Tax=Brevibacillus centrosporus TaxID=54910 RepID=UPI003D1C7D4C
MLSFFPTPYPDELMYSVFARYHVRSGNVSFKSTLQDLFGSEAIVSSIGFSSQLHALIQRLPKGAVYTADDFIDKHSIFPFYTPFLPQDRAKKIKDMLKGNQGRAVQMAIGIMAGGVCQKNRLYFCMECVSEDIQTYGESYWHRVHNTAGVFICPTHHSPLVAYPTDQLNRHGFTACPLIGLDKYKGQSILEDYESLSPKTKEMLLHLARDIQKLYSISDIPNLYKARTVFLTELQYSQYATPSGRIRQGMLHRQFELHHGNELLTLLESTIEDEFNWLSFATRKTRRTLHPIRYLLLINFVFGSLEELLNKTRRYHPFGQPPWPCLNHAADHFLKKVIDHCDVTICSDTRRPVGTFSCECGFVYSRRGPDRSERDQLRIGRIKEFGPAWLSLLANKVQHQTCSFRKIARDLGVDTKTVIKYAQLLQKDVAERSGPSQSKLKVKITKRDEAIFHSRPGHRRTQKYVNQRVNWELRDLETSIKVEAECKKILSDEMQKPIRVTIAYVCKQIGLQSLLEKHKNRLPVTMSVFKLYTEDIEQFQIRRVRWATQLLHNRNERILRWKIERIAGLRPGYSSQISDEIEAKILQYHYEQPTIQAVRDGGESHWIH